MRYNYGKRVVLRGLGLDQHARWGAQLAVRSLQHHGRQQRPPLGLATTVDMHTFALVRSDREDKERRLYHGTAPSERVVAGILGLATLSALGYAGASAAKSYEEWKAAQPSPEELEEMRKAEEVERQNAEKEPANASTQKAQDQTTGTDDRPRENFFRKFFDVGTKYYEGGFDDTMTKREAALILGVRESASPQRIKDAHRKLLILNHPDTGGSTYLSGKINEAKELLLKGRARV